MSKELEQSEKLFEAIKILMELGEKDLAFQLRVAHDTHLGVRSHFFYGLTPQSLIAILVPQDSHPEMAKRERVVSCKGSD
jgi:hypothetical protein